MPSGARRITLGFQGGQVLALRVSQEQLDGLYGSLGATGWYELDSEEGPVRVELAQLVYIGADSSEPHVGFG